MYVSYFTPSLTQTPNLMVGDHGSHFQAIPRNHKLKFYFSLVLAACYFIGSTRILLPGYMYRTTALIDDRLVIFMLGDIHI